MSQTGERRLILQPWEARAFAAGRKTQFRRPIGRHRFKVGDRLWGAESFWIKHDQDCEEGVSWDCGYNLDGEFNPPEFEYCATPHCLELPKLAYPGQVVKRYEGEPKPGDWMQFPTDGHLDEEFEQWIQTAEIFFMPWKDMGNYFSRLSSTQMPRWMSRFDLEVTAVREESIQSISETDLAAEGVIAPEDAAGKPIIRTDGKYPPMEYLRGRPPYSPFQLARAEFASLWNQANGADSWEENRPVQVVTVRLVPKEPEPVES